LQPFTFRPSGWRRWASAASRRAHRWAQPIADFGAEVARKVLPLARRGRAGAPDRILFVDDLLPDPRYGAGYPRAFAVVQAMLGAGVAVDCYPMSPIPADRRRLRRLLGGDVCLRHGDGANGLSRLLRRRGSEYRLIFVSRPSPMQAVAEALGPVQREGRLPVIYDAEAVLAPRERRRRILVGAPWTDAEYDHALSAELELARSAQAVTAVSPPDAETIASVLDVPVHVLAHAVARRPHAPGPEGRRDLLFIGRLTGAASESPNVDSLCWFAEMVLPALDRLIGSGWRLHVAGLVDSLEIAALRSDRILLHGVVDDLRPLYDQCRVFVAPTRFAAGIPLKLLEAMGQGIACVATPLLAHQLGTAPAALPTGDTAEAFADACALLYREDAAWMSARAAGLAHVDAHASPESFERTIRAVLEDAMNG
jgi:glycosyltransferase involved in cell wall biosynthesis